MTIVYKLVGIKVNSSTKSELKHKDWDDSKKTINIADVQAFFKSLGCQDDIGELKFITDSETMKEEKTYSLEAENRLIFVFTSDDKLKHQLKIIFQEHGYVPVKKEDEVEVKQEDKMDTELSKPIPMEEIKIDEKVVEESNKETVKLFEEEDFITLLRIYSDNPDMFKRFSSYISSGDVMLTDDRFAASEDIDVSSQLEEIKKLNIKLGDDIITGALKKCRGHLNLTLRYLLYNQSVSE